MTMLTCAKQRSNRLRRKKNLNPSRSKMVPRACKLIRRLTIPIMERSFAVSMASALPRRRIDGWLRLLDHERGEPGGEKFPYPNLRHLVAGDNEFRRARATDVR